MLTRQLHFQNIWLCATRRAPTGLWVLLALFFSLGTAHSQYRFDAWTTESGLPQNTVRAIRQTRDGYLWVATENGLARFDGVRFTVFNKINTPGITGNRFMSLYESRAGDLWAGSWDGGVMRYHDGVFRAYTTADGLPTNSVNRVDEDATGTIWFYHDRGLSKWQNESVILVAPKPDSPFNDFLAPPKNIHFESEELGLWRMNEAGWSRFAYGQWETLPLPAHLTDPAKLEIGWIHEDSQRRVWFNLIDRQTESFCVSEGRLKVFRGVPRNHRTAYQDSLGQLWMADAAGQGKLWKDGRATLLPGLRVLFSFEVFEDREGTLWIGTYDQGLLRRRDEVITVYHPPGGAEANFIYPILQSRGGDVWVSSGFRGLMRLRVGVRGSSQDSRFEKFLIDGRPQASELSSLFEDADGSVWVGTFRQGLARFSGGRLRYESALSAQIGGRIDVIHRDHTGNLWFGGTTGLHRLHDGRLTRYTSQEGLACNHVKALYEDRDGALWIGGYGGVSQFKDGKIMSLTLADGLSSDRVITLYGDEPGTLWIGTYDGGLNRWKNGKLTRYTSKDGLHDNNIAQILDDGKGFFWIGGSRGIYRVRKAELDEFAEGRISFITSTPFGKSDGLSVLDCNGGFQPAGFKAHDGKLWFATSNGVVVIDPETVPFNPTAPPVFIEDCILDRQSVDCRNGLRITPNHYIMEINYTGLSFIKSEQMRFRYKLQGLDHDWIEAGTRRTAYYPYVPPGSYTFSVIGANSDGVWNTTGASVQVTVIPRFWQTWWFRMLTLLAIVSVVAGAWKYRLAQLGRLAAEHEVFARQLITSQESERKRIAGELHDSVGQSLVIIRNWALLGADQLEAAAPAREELDEISETASRAISEVREIAHNLGPYHLQRLGLARLIKEMVNRIAQVSRISITTELNPLDGVLSTEAEMNLYRITQEALNNMVKHSRATKAEVTLKHDGADVRLTITDNGIGFTPQTVASSKHNDSGPSGFGMLGMSERVRLLGGALTIRSKPEQGTTLEVVLSDTSKVANKRNNEVRDEQQ